MNNKLEIRLNEVTLESVSTSETGTDLVVEGYVNETGKWSHKMRSKKGPFIEKIMPGAFSKALKNNNDIHFLAEHDSNKILSSTRNNSLTLEEDEKGLKMKATISKTTYGKDYYQLIKDGILRNMSFGFFPIKDSWKKNAQGVLERSISELALFEVSVVTNPAYPTSAISARGLDLVDEVEVPELEEETMEENRNIEKTTEEVVETKEERAYVSSIWSTRDLLTECLTIQEKILTIVNHHAKNITTSPFKESDIKAFKNAYKVLSNCMMSIAEPAPTTTVEATEAVRSLEEETVEETIETTEETKVEDTIEETKTENEERSEDPLKSFKERFEQLKNNGGTI